MSRPFDLEKAVAAWRRFLPESRALTAEDADELESHLRDEIDDLLGDGLAPEAAFERAVRRVGDTAVLHASYREGFWTRRLRERSLVNELSWRSAMLKNYATVALRSLLRHKGYSALNVAGLTLGMAVCLLLVQYVAYETSFDDFHGKKDRVYKVVLQQFQNGEDQGYGATTGVVFGPTMAQEVPGIVRYARVHPNYGDAVLSYQAPAEERTFTEEGVFFVDSTFLSLFDFPLVKGDRRSALRTPKTMLISASMAQKYFGAEEPIGKPLAFTGWVRDTYTVAGVFEDVPPNSHLRFDFLLPMEDLLANGRFNGDGPDWGWRNFVTYFEVEPAAEVEALEARIDTTYLKYQGDDMASANQQAYARLLPLEEIHLTSEVEGPAAVTADRKTVYFFSVIGLITLVIALVNYVNLAVARAMDRAKEVGVRKVVGAQKAQLVGQFLMESSLTNLVALALAIGLAMLLLPVVNRVAEVELSMTLWADGRFWAVFLGLFGLGAVLSGLYPAFILSSFKPVAALKGGASSFASRVTLRKMLVVVQFAASIALLTGTAIVYSQLRYMRGLDTGLDLEQVLVVQGPRVRAEGTDRAAEMTTLKNELRKLPAVRTIGLSSTTPGRGFDFYTMLYRETADPSTREQMRGTGIDHDFAGVYGVSLVAGEAFREGLALPDSGATEVVVNESAVRTLGFGSNEEAIGARLINGPGPGGFRVRGVVKDFQWSSAHQEAEGVMFLYQPGGGNLSMKVNTARLPETLAAIEQTYRTLFPGNPFDYYFADAAFDEQYRADQRFATLFAGFAGIAIFIACLGLFGLASFTAAQRTKEIGVRKVMGASVGSLVGLLSKEFMILVGIAFAVAAPAAYFYMKTWLADFAHRIELGPAVFLVPGVLALLVALATVSYKAVRAALADPVKSLRYE